MDYAQYMARSANTESTRRSHVAIPEAPVYPDRSSPVHTRHRIQFTPEQVDEFLQSLPRVKSSSMSKEEQRCEICSFEYGEVRGILAAPVPGKGKTRMSVPEVEEGLPGEELPELAAKLPCGHIYGEWCIKTWLLERPATCPTCRHCFQPV